MSSTAILTTDILIDRPLLSSTLVEATAEVMARRFGSEPREWHKSYRNVLKDWDNYWADLNLAESESLQQWREGRWRVERALFRLTGLRMPAQDSMALHLDKLPRDIGRRCQGWLPDAAEGLRALAGQGARVVLITPSLASPLIWGLVEGAKLSEVVAAVLGPDELGQVGLDDITWEELIRLSGGQPDRTWLISAPSDLPTLAPPGDLSHLADILPAGGVEG
jgi:hypothetical protein